MCTAGPLDRNTADQPHKSLVDESGGLQQVVIALAGHIVLCDSVKLGVDNGSQTMEGGFIPAAPGLEDTGQLELGKTRRIQLEMLSHAIAARFRHRFLTL